MPKLQMHNMQPLARFFAPKWGGVSVILVGALFWFILTKNSWLSDDFWFSARQVEQLFAGNGLRWNPHERIQLFTTVLGFSFLVLVRLLTSDFFLIYAAQAVLFNLLILMLLYPLLKTTTKWCAAVLLLTASKSYIDFSWSGLHNFIGHALLLSFLIYWARLFIKTPARHNFIALFVLAGLAPLFRHDFVLLVWPAAGYALWLARRESYPQLALYIAAMFGPLLIWTIFSLFYFGFPLPAAAYFKFGSIFPRIVLIKYGINYFNFSLHNDPLTLLVTIVAIVWLTVRGGRYGRPLAAGIVLNWFYILYSGADYMGGRFFTYTYLLSVVILVSNWEKITATIFSNRWLRSENENASHKKRFLQRPVVLVITAVLWMLGYPHTPLRAPWIIDVVNRPLSEETQVFDARSDYHESSRLFAYLAYRKGESEVFPDHNYAHVGRIISHSSVPVFHVCTAGMTSFYARLDQKIIDIYGYSDVFQARLPGVHPYPGHILRLLPRGYLESVAYDDALIVYPQINEYYKQLRLVTQSDNLFSAERLAAIIKVNLQPSPVEPLLKPFSNFPKLCSAQYDRDNMIRLREEINSIDMETLNNSDLIW